MGAQKAGTTWLFFELIKRHPDLMSWRPPHKRQVVKEPHYFDVLQPPAEEQYLKGLRLARGRNATHIDGTPDYLHIPSATCRLSAILPHARLLLVLRDPVRRALSGYNMLEQGQADSKVKVLPFAKEVEAELAALRSRHCAYDPITPSDAGTAAAGGATLPASDTPDGALHSLPMWGECFRCSFTYCGTYGGDTPATSNKACEFDLPRAGVVRRGLYAYQLDWLLQFFPARQIMVVNYEQLKSQPEPLLDQIIEFFGQDAAFKRPPKGKSAGFTVPHSSDESTRLRKTIDALYKYYAEPNRQLYALIKSSGVQGWTGDFPSSHSEYEQRLARGLDP